MTQLWECVNDYLPDVETYLQALRKYELRSRREMLNRPCSVEDGMLLAALDAGDAGQVVVNRGDGLAPLLEAAGHDSSPLLAFLNAVHCGKPKAAKRLWASAEPFLRRIAIRDQLSAVGDHQACEMTNTNRESRSYFPGELAGELGVSPDTIRKFAKIAKVQIPNRGKRNHKYTTEEAIRICRAVAAGSGSQKARRNAREFAETLPTSAGNKK